MSKIHIGPANTLHQEQYIDAMVLLNQQASSIDHTIITRERSFFENIYQQSVIAILQQQQSPDLLIGNCSVYDTEISPLRSQDGCAIKIGEVGSVIVSQEFRNQHLGNKLLTHALDQHTAPYSAIIAATINPTFEHIALTHGFSSYGEENFPKEYFHQGKKYLGSYLKAKGKDFAQVARFLIRSEPQSIQQLLSYIQQTNAL